MFWIALLLAQSAVPSQIEVGQALFLDSAKGCAGCHMLKGQGTAVGPELSDIGRISPAAIAMAVHSTSTQYVQIVKLKAGGSFPGMPGPKDEKLVLFFDLSKTPPELRKLEKAEIVSTTTNDTWKHPPAVTRLADDELASVVAYIRYAVTGQKKTVDPSEVR